MRNAFADEITQAVQEDTSLVLLSGDIGNRLFDKFKQAAGDRFFNCGVAEANMIGMAAGMALSGMKPVAYTITPFITTRVLEQIRIDVCYHDVPVTIVGVGGGLSYAALGPTHHALEDISFLRTLPNMTVLCPGDAMEVRGCFRAALNHDGPVYIRIGKKNEPVVHETVPKMEIGQSLVLRDGDDVCLLAIGNLLPTVLEAADILAAQGISAKVVSFYSAKPLNSELLADAFARFKAVATIEEHSEIGGVGSAVAEWLVDQPRRPATPLLRVNAKDAFFKKSGSQAYARRELGLTPDAVAGRVTALLAEQT